ncbi:MAG: crossover junction endodeoxyribonuclease RuvC [Parcubacteria group bacterium]|nr:crossover junction endodeoxyribonuclease RuvC [Parcubacteria group bacterium]
MIILGIDPGIADTGFGVIKKTNDSFRAQAFGTIATRKTDALTDRLKELFDGIQGLIKKYKPERIAVEQLFFAKNAKTAITVAHGRGVILLAAKSAGCEVREYTPLQVKQAITGYGAASKSQIQRMVKTILALKTIPRPDDAADALAIAICAGQTNHSLSLRA